MNQYSIVYVIIKFMKTAAIVLTGLPGVKHMNRLYVPCKGAPRKRGI